MDNAAPTPEELVAAYAQLSPEERRQHLQAVQGAIDSELTPEQDRQLVELTSGVLREGLGQQVDAANDLEVVDPETGEDPPSTKVALEILAHMATSCLGLWQSPSHFRDAHPLRRGMEQMQLIIASLSNIEPKVLALVAMKGRDERPYRLSDEAWVYMLTQAQARMARIKELKKGFEPLQAYLESRLDADLKAKLRSRVQPLVYAVGDEDVEGAKPMASAFVLEEPIAMTVPAALWQMNDPEAGKAMDNWRNIDGDGGSFNTQVDNALQRIAARLQELDTKYGIVGAISHAVLMQCAVQDLSLRYIVGIVPVIKASVDDLAAMNEGHKTAIRLAPEAGAVERSRLYAGEVGAETKPSMTLETEKDAMAAFDARLQVKEDGQMVQLLEDGTELRVNPPPTAPQGVDMAPFPTKPAEPVVNQALVVRDRTKKQKGFFKPSVKTEQ